MRGARGKGSPLTELLGGPREDRATPGQSDLSEGALKNYGKIGGRATWTNFDDVHDVKDEGPEPKPEAITLHTIL